MTIDALRELARALALIEAEPNWIVCERTWEAMYDDDRPLLAEAVTELLRRMEAEGHPLPVGAKKETP